MVWSASRAGAEPESSCNACSKAARAAANVSVLQVEPAEDVVGAAFLRVGRSNPPRFVDLAPIEQGPGKIQLKLDESGLGGGDAVAMVMKLDAGPSVRMNHATLRARSSGRRKH
jgi:hypothetical protein